MSAGFAFKRLNGHGAGTRDLLTVRRFFAGPFSSRPCRTVDSIKGTTKGRLLLWAATVLYVLGNVPDSVALAQQGVEVFKKAKDWHGVGCSTAYMSWYLAAGGELEKAVQAAEYAVKVADSHFAARDTLKVLARFNYGAALQYVGRYDDARRLYDQVQTHNREEFERYNQVWYILSFHYARFLLEHGENDKAMEVARQMEEDKETNAVAGFLRDHLAALVCLSRDPGRPKKPDLANAEMHLELSQMHLRNCPAWDQTIMNGLLVARLHRVKSELKEATSVLKDVEGQLGGFKLFRIDYLLEKAWLCLDIGAIKEAREMLHAAENQIDALCYHWKDKEVRALKKAVRQQES
jgi:tetratricopeptide (TPR) repeat protein